MGVHISTPKKYTRSSTKMEGEMIVKEKKIVSIVNLLITPGIILNFTKDHTVTLISLIGVVPTTDKRIPTTLGIQAMYGIKSINLGIRAATDIPKIELVLGVALAR